MATKTTEKSLREYLGKRITGWYENARIDYGKDGRYIRTDITGDTLAIIHEEEGERYRTIINYYKDYTPEQLYNIWMEEGWEPIAAGA